MKYTYQKLRRKIVEKYGTQRKFAKEAKTSFQTVSRKLNGHNEFSQSDIEYWADLLQIKRADYGDYFFI